MEIKKSPDGRDLTIRLVGDLDAVNAMDVEEIINKSLDDYVTCCIFDMLNLDYLSSAGLRILLATQKRLRHNNGVMTVINVNDNVMEVFKVTGFVKLLDIK